MHEFLTRFWENLGERVGGPMTFRLVIQPIVAMMLAIRDGMKDARQDRPAYFWAMIADRTCRLDLLRQGWKAVMRVFVLAIIIDAVYQLMEFRWFYPGEAIVVGLLLAFVPYLLIRGPANRIAQWCMKNRRARKDA